ncbi:hypothetical protein BRX37_14215 [Sphingomonas sp. S-NIH.Pt3_0716]|nr:hypothetical protein BRX37_14215 [Sphingomonas sp. S-NIH.Pt3_0716]
MISASVSASAAPGTQLVMGEMKVAQHAMNSVTLLNGCGLENDPEVAAVTKQVEAFLRAHTNFQGQSAYNDYKASAVLDISAKMGQAGGKAKVCPAVKENKARGVAAIQGDLKMLTTTHANSHKAK